MEDVLDEWKNYAILKLQKEEHQSDDAVIAPPKQKVCPFIPSSSCLCFQKVVVRHDIAKKILDVKAHLDKILKEKDGYNFVISQTTADPLPESWRIQSTSLVDLGKVHGRDRDMEILVNKHMDYGGSQEKSEIQVVSIIGVGGLGKTMLAQLVYNHSQVEKFFDFRIWVSVSEPFDLAAIAKGILESIEKGSSPNTNQLDVLSKHIKESILGKRFLLVLDDVWTEDYNKWESLENSLKCGGAGSKILVTTRNERVVIMMGSRDCEICRLGLLSNEDCWLLLCRMALSGRDDGEFEDIGKKIAKKCNGLPLAAKTLGSLLRFKSNLEDWENVLNSEIWEMKEAEVDIFPHLLLSYNELSPTLKRCFSYCALYPKDFEFDVESLTGNWMALGYLGSNMDEIELKGREYFEVLAMRSLFQDFTRDGLDEIQSCKMHDIVHDFAKFLRKSGRVETTRLNKSTTCHVCDPSHVSNVNEHSSLLWSGKESPLSFCDCLVRLRVINLANNDLQRIPKGMENLIHLRLLNLYGIILSRRDFQIIFQLYNLQTLSLSHSSVQEIPKEIGNLINLRHLSLCYNEYLKELPREIEDLINLRHLKFSGNPTKELAREIGILIHLRHLDLSANWHLKELLKEIGSLIHLRYLNLSRNESLEKLPGEIENLIHLKHLDLSWNGSLQELPSEIGNLIHLKYLDLTSNRSLKELPMQIGNLIHLRCLYLRDNRSLKELPNEIGNLIQLRHLDLSWSESLKELPESICGLKKLQTLNVYKCASLSGLPEGLDQLIGLCSLE